MTNIDIMSEISVPTDALNRFRASLDKRECDIAGAITELLSDAILFERAECARTARQQAMTSTVGSEYERACVDIEQLILARGVK